MRFNRGRQEYVAPIGRVPRFKSSASEIVAKLAHVALERPNDIHARLKLQHRQTFAERLAVRVSGMIGDDVLRAALEDHERKAPQEFYSDSEMLLRFQEMNRNSAPDAIAIPGFTPEVLRRMLSSEVEALHSRGAIPSRFRIDPNFHRWP